MPYLHNAYLPSSPRISGSPIEIQWGSLRYPGQTAMLDNGHKWVSQG